MLRKLFVLILAPGILCARDDRFYGPQTFNNNDDGSSQPARYSEPVSTTWKNLEWLLINIFFLKDGPRAPPSAILTHKQGLTNGLIYNSHIRYVCNISLNFIFILEGVFNYVFAADNGLKQGESIAPDGTRTGAYEYVDPNGKTVFVKYTAGKDGFRVSLPH